MNKYEEALKVIRDFRKWSNVRGRKYSAYDSPVRREDLSAALSVAIRCLSVAARQERKAANAKGKV